jgi:amidohydrolase
LSELDVGKIAALEGPCTAAADTSSVRVSGRGGHAAFPHATVDPVAVAAQVVANLQHVVARATPPLDSVVVPVTRIAGGTADNIVPEAVELGGTVRTHARHQSDRTRDAMARVVDGVTAAHGATGTFAYVEGYEPVVNDPAVAAIVRAAAGADRLVDHPPLMAGDDFSSYLRVAPGCFFFVGAGGEAAFPHHHPRFTIDESALPVGIEALARTAPDFLADTTRAA